MIDILTGFYNHRLDVKYTSVEADLLVYLFVVIGEEPSMAISNGRICMTLGITDKTLSNARDGLVQKGVLEVMGGKGKGSPTYILNRNLFRKYSGLNSGLNSKTGNIPVYDEKKSKTGIYTGNFPVSKFLLSNTSIVTHSNILDSYLDTLSKKAIYLKKTKNIKNIFFKKKEKNQSIESDEILEPEVISVEAEKVSPKKNGGARKISESTPRVDNPNFGDGRLEYKVLEFKENNPNLYPDNLYEDFLNYWTECNEFGRVKKEKWENCQTWETSKRLATWFKNDKFNKYKNGNSKAAAASRNDYRTNVGRGLDDLYA